MGEARAGTAGRLPGLDGLRAIAATGVMLLHASAAPGFPDVRWLHAAIGAWGGLCVPLFFVLSGFLITHLLAAEEGATGGVSLRDFYARRALRILPAALAYLGVVAALSAWGPLGVRPVEIVAALFWFRNLLYGGWAAWARNPGDGIFYTGHFWSLSVEEHFYLAWPPAFRWLRGGRRIAVLVAALAVLPAWRALNVKWSGAGGMNHWRTDLAADHIVAGSLLALLRARMGAGEAWAAWVRRWAPWAIAAGIAGQAASLFGPSQGPVWRATVVLGTTLNWIGLGGVVAWAALGGGGWIRWFLGCVPMTWLGGISYSLYLWQQLFAGKHLPAWMQSFPANVALALGAATASHYLVERPFLRLRARFRRHGAAGA